MAREARWPRFAHPRHPVLVSQRTKNGRPFPGLRENIELGQAQIGDETTQGIGRTQIEHAWGTTRIMFLAVSTSSETRVCTHIMS
jgi:hypothetical protein